MSMKEEIIYCEKMTGPRGQFLRNIEKIRKFVYVVFIQIRFRQLPIIDVIAVLF